MAGRAFVTGATGFLGRAIVEDLVAAGRPVRALARSDSRRPAARRRSAPNRCAATCATERRSRRRSPGARSSTTWPGSTRSACPIRGRCSRSTSPVRGRWCSPRRRPASARWSTRRRPRPSMSDRRSGRGRTRALSLELRAVEVRGRAGGDARPRRSTGTAGRLRQPGIGPGSGADQRDGTAADRLPQRQAAGRGRRAAQRHRHRRLHPRPPAGRGARRRRASATCSAARR